MVTPIPCEHRVIVAAAAAAVVGNNVRILWIRPVAQPGTGAWVHQGRLGIQASHVVAIQRGVRKGTRS